MIRLDIRQFTQIRANRPGITYLLGALSAAAIIGASSVRVLEAQITVWDGGGDNQTWSDPSNWTAGVPNSATADVRFDANSAPTSSIDLGPFTFSNRVKADIIRASDLTQDITLTNSLADGVLELYGSNTFTNDILSSGGGLRMLTIENDIQLFNQRIGFNADVDGSGLVITGDITTGNTEGLTILTLTGRNTQLPVAIDIRGNLSDGPGDRLRVDTGYEPDGANHRNVVRLTGDNTFSGGINVFTNTLEFDSVANTGVASALGAGDANDLAADQIDIGQGSYTGTIRYIGTQPAGHSTNRNINLFGSTGGARIEANGVGPLVFDGAVTASNSNTKTLTLTGMSTGTINGVVNDINGGSINVRKEGTGTWTLSNNNLYAGTTVVIDGELKLTGRIGTETYAAGWLAIGDGGTFTLDGGFAKVTDLNNLGTLDFRSGELRLEQSINDNGAGGSFDIGTSGQGIVRLNGGSQTFGDITLDGNDDQLIINAGGTYQFSNLDNSVGGVVSGNTGPNIQINGGTFTNRVDGNTTREINSRIQGTGGFTKQGSGIVRFNGEDHTYTGPTRIEEGTVEVGFTSKLPDLSDVFVAEGATLDLSSVSNGDEIGAATGGGTIINGQNSPVAIDTHGTSASFGGSITGAGDFYKRGTGTQTLSGPNTYAGVTRVEADGTLELAEGGSITVSNEVQYTNSTLLVSGGTIDTPGTIRPIGSRAVLTLTDGLIKANQIDRTWNSQYLDTFNWTGGTVQLLSDTRIAGSVARADQPFEGSLSLTAQKHLIVDENLAVTLGGELSLDGGSVTANNITTGDRISGTGFINFNSGSMHLGSDQDLTADRLSALDLATPIDGGRTFKVDGIATISAPVTLAGGVFSAGSVVHAEDLILAGGTLEITAGNLSTAAAKSLDATNGTTINVSGSLRNAGSFGLIGSVATFAAASTSQSGAEINAINSTLTFEAGLTNNGQLNLINSEVVGPLANNGAIEVAGIADFAGDVSGSGAFRGNGTSLFSKSFGPGAGPAEVQFAGDVVFSASNTLEIDLESDANFDRLVVAGPATLGGTLDVQLLGGFTPKIGDQFAFLTAGAINGRFDDFDFPTFDGKTFDISYGDDAVSLEVVIGSMLCGDFDSDGDVDSADNTTLVSNWTGALLPGEGDRDFEQGDCDGDGDVDSADRTGLVSNWTGAEMARLVTLSGDFDTPTVDQDTVVVDEHDSLLSAETLFLGSDLLRPEAGGRVRAAAYGIGSSGVMASSVAASAVPEPDSQVLGMLALTMILLRRKRRSDQR